MVQISDNMRGAALMAGSMTAFTVNDGFMKALSDELPLMQALFLRGVAVVICLTMLARILGQWRFDLSRRDWWLIGIRSGAEIVASLLFLTALFHMPIANISAILQSLPLAVTLAAAVFFGEPLGWRRMLAIALGFVGVLLIVRPGAEGFTLYSLYALGAVVLVTVRDLAARRLSVQVPSLVVALVAAVSVTLASGLLSLGVDWAELSPKASAQLAGSALFILGGYVFSVAAMRVGEISFIAPFRYTSLLVALVIGVLIFGDFPDGLTLIGAGIVVATGLFTLYREARLKRRQSRAP